MERRPHERSLVTIVCQLASSQKPFAKAKTRASSRDRLEQKRLEATTQIGLVTRDLEHRRHPHQVESTT